MAYTKGLGPRIKKLMKNGFSNSQISAMVSCSPPTVSYHARGIGVEKKVIQYDWNLIRKEYENGLSATACRKKFGFAKGSWNKAIKRGDIVMRPIVKPLEEVLRRGVKYSRFHLKRRLVEVGIFEYRCSVGKLSKWRGVQMSLHLHHINGVGDDNRLRNLCLLCPNCHGNKTYMEKKK